MTDSLPSNREFESRREHLKRELIQAGIIERHEGLTLRSGESSLLYVNVKEVTAEHPNLYKKLVELMREKLPPETTRIVSMGEGGKISEPLSIESDLPHTRIRSKAKGYGVESTIIGQGISSRDKVVIVDDVCTTGSSLRETAQIIVKNGAEVIGALVVVKRGDGEIDFPLEYLYTLEDFV
jgi:orotate phosphoribosyltransferase